MSLLPYSLARPILFGLDPETAHELTLKSLARLQGTLPVGRYYWAITPVDAATATFSESVPSFIGMVTRRWHAAT